MLPQLLRDLCKQTKIPGNWSEILEMLSSTRILPGGDGSSKTLEKACKNFNTDSNANQLHSHLRIGGVLPGIASYAEVAISELASWLNRLETRRGLAVICWLNLGAVLVALQTFADGNGHAVLTLSKNKVSTTIWNQEKDRHEQFYVHADLSWVSNGA